MQRTRNCEMILIDICFIHYYNSSFCCGWMAVDSHLWVGGGGMALVEMQMHMKSEWHVWRRRCRIPLRKQTAATDGQFSVVSLMVPFFVVAPLVL